MGGETYLKSKISIYLFNTIENFVVFDQRVLGSITAPSAALYIRTRALYLEFPYPICLVHKTPKVFRENPLIWVDYSWV